jgi:hypothetical protein
MNGTTVVVSYPVSGVILLWTLVVVCVFTAVREALRTIRALKRQPRDKESFW